MASAQPPSFILRRDIRIVTAASNVQPLKGR